MTDSTARPTPAGSAARGPAVLPCDGDRREAWGDAGSRVCAIAGVRLGLPGDHRLDRDTYALSLLIPVASIVMVWRDPLRRALHDRVAGIRVVRS